MNAQERQQRRDTHETETALSVESVEECGHTVSLKKGTRLAYKSDRKNPIVLEPASEDPPSGTSRRIGRRRDPPSNITVAHFQGHCGSGNQLEGHKVFFVCVREFDFLLRRQVKVV